MERRDIAVFDFDGTLTRDDTFISFARHALSLPRLIAATLRSLPVLAAWKLGFSSNSRAKQQYYSALYRGLNREAILRAAETFSPRYRPEILSRLTGLRDAGTEIWIVTASLDLWMERIARDLGVKLLCTHTETAPDGTLTGRFATPNCHGEEKVARLRAATPDLDNCNITLYANELHPGGGDAPLSHLATSIITPTDL